MSGKKYYRYETMKFELDTPEKEQIGLSIIGNRQKQIEILDDECKEILFREIDSILPDGRIPTRYPYSIIGSADGVGWAFKRFYDIMKMLKSAKKFDSFFNSIFFHFLHPEIFNFIIISNSYFFQNQRVFFIF